MAVDVRKSDARTEVADLRSEMSVLRGEMAEKGRYLSVVGGTIAHLLEPRYRPLAMAVVRTGESLTRRGDAA
jgi:hypothetical protein